MRKVYLDILNIMACYAVVILHCTSKAWQVDGSLRWYIAIVLQGLFIWAVTIFFMLTGAKCINFRERYSTKILLKKRLLKTILIFAGFSMLYVLFFSIAGRMNYESLSDIIKALINNEVVTIFWFFGKLIPLYMVIPIISLLDNNMKIYFVVLSFLVNFLLPYIDRIFAIKLSGYTLQFANIIVAIAIIGFILDKEEIKKWLRIAIYLSSLFCMSFNIIMTIKLSLNEKEYIKTYINSTSLTTIIIAIGLWVFIKEFFSKRIKLSEKMIHFISEISSCCFGVYLIQLFFLELLGHMNKIDKMSPIYSIGGSFVIFSLCVGIVFCWNKYCLSYVKAKKEKLISKE